MFYQNYNLSNYSYLKGLKIISFNNYKNIAHVIQDFPLNYQEKNFIEEISLEIESSFRQKFELVLTEGVVI